MTHSWLDDVLEMSTAAGAVVRVVVIEARGSTPRDVGAHMLIGATAISGTIGGGALEYDVIARARELLRAEPHARWLREVQSYHLGPELAQCCGGSMRLLLERFGPAEADALHLLRSAGIGRVTRPLTSGAPLLDGDGGMGAPDTDTWFSEPLASDLTPLVIYGAGHVGRAIVAAVAPLPFAVSWIDVAEDRFPSASASGPMRVCLSDPAAYVADAAPLAFHLVMTHSHAIDEDIVGAVLAHGDFAYLGLIGSETKRARFVQRLARRGLSETLLRRLTCPIGLPGVSGKAPAIIAASVVADLLLRRGAMARVP